MVEIGAAGEGAEGSHAGQRMEGAIRVKGRISTTPTAYTLYRMISPPLSPVIRTFSCRPQHFLYTGFIRLQFSLGAEKGMARWVS